MKSKILLSLGFATMTIIFKIKKPQNCLTNYNTIKKGGSPCSHEEINNILFTSVMHVYYFH